MFMWLKPNKQKYTSLAAPKNSKPVDTNIQM